MKRATAVVLVAAATWLVGYAMARSTSPEQEFGRGLAALAAGDFPVAERRFRAVVQSDPRSYEGYNNLAVACAAQGHDEEAAAALQTAIRLRPEYERAHQNLAAVYVRLAAKQLLAAAQHTEGARRQSFALTARALLEAGPKLAPPDLLAQAASLATAPAVRASEAAPATPTPTPTATPPAVATPSAPRPTPVRSLARVEAVEIEPVGARALVIDPARRVARLFRRDTDGLTPAGQWPLAIHGRVGGASLLQVSRRSNFSVRLRDPARAAPASWLIESAAKSTKAPDAIVLATPDFRAATQSLVPGQAVVVVAANGTVALSDELGAELRRRVEAWRAAWSTADLKAYASFYAADFVDDDGRSRADWEARKRAIFEHSGTIRVAIEQVAVNAFGAVADVTFEQSYASALQRSRCRKELVWRESAPGVWQIAAERVVGE